MGEVGGALLHRPFLHGGGDGVGERRVERPRPRRASLEHLEDGLGEALALDGGEKTLAPKTVAPGWVRSVTRARRRSGSTGRHGRSGCAAWHGSMGPLGGNDRQPMPARANAVSKWTNFAACVRPLEDAPPLGEGSGPDFGPWPKTRAALRGDSRRDSRTRRTKTLKDAITGGSCAASAGAAGCPLWPAADTFEPAQQSARQRRDQLDLGGRRRLPRDVHAGGLRVPGDRLLPRQERGHRGREDPHELLDRRAHVLGGGLRLRLRRRRLGHRDPRILPARLRRPAEGLRRHGPLGRADEVEVGSSSSSSAPSRWRSCGARRSSGSSSASTSSTRSSSPA